MAQQFFTQMRANGKNQVVMGSDGTDDPSTFKGAGSYVSGFPVDSTTGASRRSRRRTTASRRSFGLPTYTVGHGQRHRDPDGVQGRPRQDDAGCGPQARGQGQAEQKVSLLGFPVEFLKSNHGKFQGPGDMGGSAAFGIYKITKQRQYKRVG